MKKILCCAALALFLSSCAVSERRNQLAVAAVTGGLAGAFVGWQVFGAGGEGVLGAFAIGGASAGFGYLMADTLIPRERESFQKAAYRSLQVTPDGQATQWSSGDAAARASITPMRSFRDKAGRLCREFVVAYIIGKSRDSMKRTACRGADGSWRTI